MKNTAKTAGFLLFCTLLAACGSTPQTTDSQTTAPVPQAEIKIEPQKGRINVQTSVARGVKYNQEAVKAAAYPKFFGQDAEKNAVSNLYKLREHNGGALSTALKELDFAILYTSVNLFDNPELVNRIYTQTINQNLVLGAVKSHKNTLYNHNKIFETERKIRQTKKQIAFVLKRKNLKENDIEYQKALENSVDKLNALHQEMQQNIEDFRQLVKIDAKKFEIEGKRFFDELYFSEKSNVEDYQAAALHNRVELQPFSNKYTLEEIAGKTTASFPENSAAVKGFYLQDSAFLSRLAAQGDAQALKLLQDMTTYQKASKTKKLKLYDSLVEELHKAIYLQNLLAWNIAQKTTTDLKAHQKATAELKALIKKLQKISHPTHAQQLELLQLKLELANYENIENQIAAERAVAVIALHFYSGMLAINDTSSQNLTDIAALFQNGLKQQIPEAQKQDKDYSALTVADDKLWAHKDNWLEELMSEPAKAIPTVVPVKATVKKTPQTKSTESIQLGAFLEQNNGMIYWKEVSAAVPELKKYTPVYEKASIAGIPMFRLLIKSPGQNLMPLCLHIRNQNRECLLRD